MAPRRTLSDYFDAIAALDAPYLVYDDGYRPRQYSYRDVARAARAFAARLAAAGIDRGDRVILWSENSPAWVAAFWGCVLRGVAVAPIDERHSTDFLARVEQAVQPKAVLIGEQVTLPPRPGGAPVWPLGGLDWESDAAPAFEAATPDDIAEILFTSGATAEPKGVVITHRNILANIVPVEGEVLKYRKYGKPFYPIRFLNLLPLSHMFGQAMALFIPPMLAGTVIFQRSQNPAEIVRQIKSRRISVLVAVPKVLEVLREYVAGLLPETEIPPPTGIRVWGRWWRYRRAHRLFGMKFWSFIVGGAALAPEIEDYWGRLGFLVIQGYGLTEAAPIVTLNHPFHARKGTVGKPIHGVEIKIAADGEVLVRGGNVSSGYYNNQNATDEAFTGGWLHTGDIGELDASGRLLIRGRKKEMIVLPDGRNVFPEDVEHALDSLEGVVESAVVGLSGPGGEMVHAALIVAPGVTVEAVLRQANARLEEHQKLRGATLWPDPELPRTEGTRKLKRRAIRARLAGEVAPTTQNSTTGVESLLSRYASNQTLKPETTLDELGLSSLDRVELLVALEQKLGAEVDEAAFAQARTVADLEALRRTPTAAPARESDFPTWNRHWLARAVRAVNLVWILALARVFAWVRVRGRENLRGLTGPVIFASNHQSYFDAPILFISMPWSWRLRLAPTMRKEYFDAHFHPQSYPLGKRFSNSLGYLLSALVFQGVPLPQREAGARETMRYLGGLAAEGVCPLIFPEGKHSYDDSVGRFLPGVAMMAARLKLPVVPIRIRGANRVLHPTWLMAKPGFVDVCIGKPVDLEGEDYVSLARQLEQIVRAL